MSWAQAGTSLASIENEGEFDRYNAAAGQNTGHSWKIWKPRSKLWNPVASPSSALLAWLSHDFNGNRMVSSGKK